MDSRQEPNEIPDIDEEEIEEGEKVEIEEDGMVEIEEGGRMRLRRVGGGDQELDEVIFYPNTDNRTAAARSCLLCFVYKDVFLLAVCFNKKASYMCTDSNCQRTWNN